VYLGQELAESEDDEKVGRASADAGVRLQYELREKAWRD
jgi:hypothetical protein